MRTQARWVYVLIGDNNTGKTTFQKLLVKALTGENRGTRLDCDLMFEIRNDNFVRKIRNIFIGSRSLQERMPDHFRSVDEYFDNHFGNADICVISTHLKIDDVRRILQRCRGRFYNVCGVFFSNSIQRNPKKNSPIASLFWDERWIVENSPAEESDWGAQIEAAVDSFVAMLVERTRGW